MPVITTNLDHAVLDLQAGKLVAIPTETVYGLAAMINNEGAIKAVFSMKNRPLTHPLIVHVGIDWDLNQFVEYIPEYAQQLINKFWPGPLTLVFQAKENQINPLITGGQTTVAIRCPAHPIAQKLLNKLNTALVAPSANPFGKISPTTSQHVQQAFHDKELTILDGGRCQIGIESTIVDATDKSHYQILRHGLIDEYSLSEVISINYSSHKNEIRVPGKLDSHYQPQKKLYYFERYDELTEFCKTPSSKVFVLALQRPPTIEKEQFYCLSNQPHQVAFDLYFQLRKADESSVDCIAIQLPPDTSEWQGIRERILKAGSSL
jgi:L-threonylcarbamoyladenylate synthase